MMVVGMVKVVLTGELMTMLLLLLLLRVSGAVVEARART